LGKGILLLFSFQTGDQNSQEFAWEGYNSRDRNTASPAE